MPLKYLIDENLRGKFTRALIEKGHAEGLPLDLIETGAADGPELGIQDDELLRWAQAHDRVLVSLDKNTIPEFLANHLAAGGRSPGVLLIRRTQSWNEILYYLVLFAETASADECADRCTYIPL